MNDKKHQGAQTVGFLSIFGAIVHPSAVTVIGGIALTAFVYWLESIRVNYPFK